MYYGKTVADMEKTNIFTFHLIEVTPWIDWYLKNMATETQFKIIT